MRQNYSRDFAIFVDDLGGLLWHMKIGEVASWEDMAGACHCAESTLIKLANRITKNPTMYTCWKILRGLDHASVIRHSTLEKYRGLANPKPRKKPRKPKVVKLETAA